MPHGSLRTQCVHSLRAHCHTLLSMSNSLAVTYLTVILSSFNLQSFAVASTKAKQNIYVCFRFQPEFFKNKVNWISILSQFRIKYMSYTR